MENKFIFGKKIIAIIAIIFILGALAYYYKNMFIVATVNGKPISRFAVLGKLESASGKQALDALIIETLIKSELDKNNITVGEEEIDAKLKQIEAGIVAQGGTLEQALSAEKLTMEQLREQISTQVRLEKFHADRAQVTDEELNNYITDNGIEIPKEQEITLREQIKSELKSQKFNKLTNEWVSSLQSAAAINYFKYK